MSKFWRKLMANKEKDKQEKQIVAEAISREVTPAIELAIHRATKEDISLLDMMMKYGSFIGVITLAVCLVSMTYTFESHFGEDNWDDMIDSIPEEDRESMDKLSLVLQVIMFIVLIDVIFLIWGSVRNTRYESKMKKIIVEGTQG